MQSKSKVRNHVWEYVSDYDRYKCRVCSFQSKWVLAVGEYGTPECMRINLTKKEKATIEEITTAAYAGGTDRKPEDDVRWLLALLDRIVGED